MLEHEDRGMMGDRPIHGERMRQ
ncbi:MAG: hypothetical protein E2P02_03640 [Acidobacteria bacterium]|nr:MAG: hypothetical protein E2P02_03640 [Acidobacteriota bacterium]